MVGAPNREYLWILSRTPEMPASAWDASERAAKENGFDLARLLRHDKPDSETTAEKVRD